MYINFVQNHSTVEIFDIPEFFANFYLDKSYQNGTDIFHLTILSSPNAEPLRICTFDAGNSETNFQHATEALTKIMAGLKGRQKYVDIPMNYRSGIGVCRLHDGENIKTAKINLGTSTKSKNKDVSDEQIKKEMDQAYEELNARSQPADINSILPNGYSSRRMYVNADKQNNK